MSVKPLVSAASSGERVTNAEKRASPDSDISIESDEEFGEAA